MVWLAVTTALCAEEPWARSLEKQGVVIETRKVSGSDYKEFRATMIVNANLAKSLAVMQDFSGYKRWMKDCKESRRLAELSPSSGIVYSLQSAPWPIAEREAVVRYSYQKTVRPASVLIWLAAAGMVAHLPFETLKKLREVLEK